jgi:proteasome alpha subunit
MQEQWVEGGTFAEALQAAVDALAGPDRSLVVSEIEVAVLDRAGPRRAFRRVEDEDVTAVLGGNDTNIDT